MLGTRQYGGSQSALLLRIPLLRLPINRSMSRLALTGRASIGHDDPSEREFAAGLQWRPSASLPAQFALERRFRPDRNDAFAGFVAVGTTKRHCRWGLPLMPTDKQALLLAKMVAALPMFKCMRSSPLLRSGVQVWRQAQARGVAGKARSCGSILGRRSARNCNLAPRTSDWMQAGAFASRATHGLAMAQL